MTPDEVMAQLAVSSGRVDDFRGDPEECVYTHEDVRKIELNAAMAGIKAERNRRLTQLMQNLPECYQKVRHAIMYAAYVKFDSRDQLNAAKICEEAIPYMERLEHDRCDMIDQLHAQEIATDSVINDLILLVKDLKAVITDNHTWHKDYGNDEGAYCDPEGFESALCATNTEALKKIGLFLCKLIDGNRDTSAQPQSPHTTTSTKAEES